MRNSILSAVLFGLALLAIAPQANAQYINQSVLQKDFEGADFFFRSTYLNPYGLDGFGPVAAGVIRDPLLDLQLSPSLARADSARGTTLYVDFRSSRQEARQDQYYYPTRDFAVADQALTIYPGYYRPSIRRPEPVLGLGLFTRPAATLPNLTIGATYRLISNDQAYYDIPDGQYRGLDFAAEAVDSGVPVVDVYSGSDQMRATGHFGSFFASYALNPTWRVGARADFTSFNRDGEFGTVFNPGVASTSSGRQSSSQFEARTQSYRHTDLSVGVDGALSPTMRVGATLGYLSGTAEQLQDGASLYDYAYGSTNPVEDGSFYTSGSMRLAEIDREGGSRYAGLFMRRSLSRGRTLTASWRGDWQSLDLTGSSMLADSSRSESHYSGNGYENHHLSAYSRSDVREGSGAVDGVNHRLAVGLDWRLNNSTTLILGAVATHLREETKTFESVETGYDSAWDSRWSDGNNGNENVHDESFYEEKDLNWTLDNRRTAIQIPILVSHTFSEHFEFQAGITRRMEDIKVKDEVLADVAHRHSMINGRETNASNLRERYRQPTAYRSTVTTSALLALIARPSPDFEVRLSVSPRRSTGYYSENRTQWWLGFQFQP